MATITPLGYAGTGSIVPPATPPTPPTTPAAPPGETLQQMSIRLAQATPKPPAPTTTTLHNPDGSVNTQAGAGAVPPAGSTPPNPSDPGYYSRYTPQETAADQYLNQDFKAPKTPDEIQADMTTQAQGEIDNLNKYYDSLLQEQNVVNEGRNRGTASVSTLSGLAGSTEANVASDKTSTLNATDNAKIQNERSVAIGGILSKIRSDAVTEARAQRDEARQSATDILAGRTQRQTEATTQLTNLAKSGVTAEGLATQDPQSYQHLVQMVGGEDQLKALFTINRPQDDIIDKQLVNGKYIIAYKNPITGETKVDTLDTGLPPQYDKTADLGDRIMFYNASFDLNDPNSPQPVYVQKNMDPLKQLQMQGQALDNKLKAQQVDEGTPESLAQSLVEGRMAPTELSKRVTGSAGYNTVLAAADKYSMATTGKHFDISKANRDYKFAVNINTQNTLNFLSSLVGDASTGTKGNIDDLLAASDKVTRTNFPAINSAEFQALYQSGDTNVVSYVTTATEVADQVAKILQGGGTGSGTSDAKLKQAISLFNSSFSKDQLAATVKAIKPLLQNRARGMINNNPYLSDYADQFGLNAPQGGGDPAPIDAPDGSGQKIIITD